MLLVAESTVATEIAAANAKFVEAFARHDAAAIASFYTDEGIICPPGADVMQGHAAIQTFWQAPMDMGVTGASLDSIEVEHLGDTVIELGKFSMWVEGGLVVDYGKYIVVWKHDRGVWKLHRDIWNTSKAG